MGYIISTILSIIVLFIFPTIVWEIDLPSLFELTETTNFSKFENLAKKYNIIETTTQEFASQKILYTFLFAIIFFILFCIITAINRKRKKAQILYNETKQKLKQEKIKYKYLKNNLSNEKKLPESKIDNKKQTKGDDEQK